MMAEKEVMRKIITGILDDILEAAEQIRLEQLEHNVRARYEETQTFEWEKEELEKKHNSEHPTVKALERAGLSARCIAVFADTTLKYAEYGSGDKPAGYSDPHQETSSPEPEGS